jgi:hypothetical protein
MLPGVYLGVMKFADRKVVPVFNRDVKQNTEHLFIHRVKSH